MLLRLIRGDCSDGKTCPALHQADPGTLVVQGWIVTDAKLLGELALPDGEQAVEVPVGLLPEVADSWPAMQRTARGTLVVTGSIVTDPDALRQLRLAPHELAVEVPARSLAKVLEAC